MKHYQNKKYIYELATEKDGSEITTLLEKTAFDGDISLIYAKRPDAINAVKKESNNYAIVIGRDVKNNKIKGVGICTSNEMLVNGKSENIAYLGGLRVEQDATLNIIDAYEILENFVKTNNIKYTYTTILQDNLYAQKMLTKKRRLMPYYKKIADYTVNIFSKKLKYKSKYVCRKVNDADRENLKIFIQRNSKDKIFFPKIDVDKTFYGLNYNDFYILENQGNREILACGILWEQSDYKQLIIKKYSKKYKILKKFLNPFLNIFKVPKFPDENEIIKYQTLSFVLYKNDTEEYLVDFIKQISNFVEFEFFVYGSTKPFSKNFAPIKYNSLVYLVDWDKNIDIKTFKDNKIHIECGLL